MTDEEKSKEPVQAKPEAKPKPKRKAAPRKSAATSTAVTDTKSQAATAAEKPADPPSSPPPPPPVTQPATAAPPPASPVVEQPKKGGNVLGLIALVLVIVLAGGGYFLHMQMQKQMDALSQELSNAQDDHAQNSNQLEQSLSSLSEQLQSYSEATDGQLGLLEKQVGKSKRQWLIVEAEYLASVANVRLQLAGDVNTAIAALRAADQRLKDNGSPSLFAIRQQIAREIGTLQSTAMPDVVGLSSRILSLESRVGVLKVTDPHTGVAQAPGVGGEGVHPVPEDWEKALKSAWDNFSKMVVVRRNDKPISAMMTPEQVDVIQKNLALKLETARLALVHQDEALYQASLDIVAQWLAEYFDQAQHEVSAALSEIKALKQENIIPVLPDISGSLMALRDLPLLQMSGEPAVSPEPAEAAVKSAPEPVAAEPMPESAPQPTAEPARSESVKEPAVAAEPTSDVKAPEPAKAEAAEPEPEPATTEPAEAGDMPAAPGEDAADTASTETDVAKPAEQPAQQ